MSGSSETLAVRESKVFVGVPEIDPPVLRSNEIMMRRSPREILRLRLVSREEFHFEIRS